MESILLNGLEIGVRTESLRSKSLIIFSGFLNNS
jgi:hypothetical protein